MAETIYGSIIQTKNNSYIPLLKNGKSLESKYNPEREAESIILQIEKNYNFFVLIGVGSGILLKLLTANFPEATIIGVENSEEDIIFLKQIQDFKDCLNNKKIKIITLDNLQQTLLNNYLPGIYGDIKIIFQRNWTLTFPELYENARNIINKTIKEISLDYSTQVHFGKLWQNNILRNLKILGKQSNNQKLEIDNTKIAAVIAAGPTLDKTIEELQKQRDNYYIISTDTAFQTLLKSKIIPEMVVSIDGQLISSSHFFTGKKINTTYIFDLCANNNIVQKIINNDSRLYFYSNGHPLSQLSSNMCTPSLPHIYTGSGTVTIAALDIAIKTGFKNIQIFGADFGYCNGKPYAKGTYLDNIYNNNSTLINSSENTFDALMFRTELKKITEFKKTNTILEAYKKSLETFLTEQKIDYINSENKYLIINNLNQKLFFNKIEFDYSRFVSSITKENYFAFLPYIAWLRNKNKSAGFDELLNLAYKEIVRYN